MKTIPVFLAACAITFAAELPLSRAEYQAAPVNEDCFYEIDNDPLLSRQIEGGDWQSCEVSFAAFFGKPVVVGLYQRVLVPERVE